MKKLVILVCALYSMLAFAQNANSRRESLYQVLKKAQNPSEKVRAWQNISDDYGYTGQPDSSRFASEQMLKIATDSHQDSLLAPTYIGIGFYFSLVGDYKQSLEFDFKSLSFAEKSKNASDMWLATKEIGSLFKELKNYGEALKYLKRSEAILKTGNVESTSAANRTYSHIAETFLGLRQNDSALRYIQLTNEVTSKEKDAYGFARMLYIFASVYLAKGDADLAESYYKKCIAFSDAGNINVPYVTSTTDYAQYLFDICFNY
jgi:tetratricopeptide (TPR) repeat protein